MINNIINAGIAINNMANTSNIAINSLLHRQHLATLSKRNNAINKTQNNNNHNHKYQKTMNTKFIKIEYYVGTYTLVTEEMFINPAYIETFMVQHYDGPNNPKKLERPKYMLSYLNQKYELTVDSFMFLYDTFVSNNE